MSIAWKWGRLEGAGGRDGKKPQGKLWRWLNVYNIFFTVTVSRVYTHIASYQIKYVQVSAYQFYPPKDF